MVLQQVAGRRTGEDVDDLQGWLRGLDGCPSITSTAVASCANPVHGEPPATWFYVEGDARQALARRRCLACGVSVSTLDSAERWSHPPMWACSACGQSIVELAAGLSEDDGRIRWVALGVRCVGCGQLDGLTDFVVDGTPEEILRRL